MSPVFLKLHGILMSTTAGKIPITQPDIVVHASLRPQSLRECITCKLDTGETPKHAAYCQLFQRICR
jgi:hypothetical protein